MKLELKHLAPYLPYGLKYFDKDTNEIKVMRSISTEINLVDMGWGNAHDLYQFKPILRPLSDLDTYLYRKLTATSISYMQNRYSNQKKINYDNFPYKDFIMLLENHFDVFGLIEKDLAIDINTIKQTKTKYELQKKIQSG